MNGGYLDQNQVFVCMVQQTTSKESYTFTFKGSLIKFIRVSVFTFCLHNEISTIHNKNR